MCHVGLAVLPGNNMILSKAHAHYIVLASQGRGKNTSDGVWSRGRATIEVPPSSHGRVILAVGEAVGFLAANMCGTGAWPTCFTLTT